MLITSTYTNLAIVDTTSNPLPPPLADNAPIDAIVNEVDKVVAAAAVTGNNPVVKQVEPPGNQCHISK